MIDLCDLPKEPNVKTNKQSLDGHSLRPLLDEPKGDKWDGPPVALTVIYGQDKQDREVYHYTVRSKDWRYTLYSNDAEELYDHRKDPYEWYNLAQSPTCKKIKNELKQELFRLLGTNHSMKRGLVN